MGRSRWTAGLPGTTLAGLLDGSTQGYLAAHPFDSRPPFGPAPPGDSDSSSRMQECVAGDRCGSGSWLVQSGSHRPDLSPSGGEVCHLLEKRVGSGP